MRLLGPMPGRVSSRRSVVTNHHVVGWQPSPRRTLPRPKRLCSRAIPQSCLEERGMMELVKCLPPMRLTERRLELP
jgi:hypothetical protein